jgi:RNA polymerase sigma factor (TIGR02999 family)
VHFVEECDGIISPRAMSGEVTQILSEWRAGDPHAVDRLIPLLYEELRGLAQRQLGREPPGHTLSATALVHEAYLRLLQQRRLEATDRNGFLAIVGVTMRRILVDHARARMRLKRGGGKPEPLDPLAEPPLLTPVEVDEVLAIDIALERLAKLDERALRVVECRVFGGLTLEETARVLDLSTRSVQRSWNAARAWLRKEIGAGGASA